MYPVCTLYARKLYWDGAFWLYSDILKVWSLFDRPDPP